MELHVVDADAPFPLVVLHVVADELHEARGDDQQA